MQFVEVVRASREVSSTRARTAKIERLASLLRALSPDEIEVAVGFLSGELRQGRIGVGGALLRRLLDAEVAAAPSLSVLEVDAAFERFSRTAGRGSAAERERILGELFRSLTFEEREFAMRLAIGELRQGALEGVMLESLARASNTAPSVLRRAMLFAGSIGKVALAALTEGEAKLASFSLELFRPLRPMLADTAPSIEAALARIGPSALEYKLDGARIQVHRAGQDVAVFSRQGQDVTASVPEIVEHVRALDVRDIVLDGEAIAFDAEGWPLPFQTTMQRFGRQSNVEALRKELPLSSRFFDCLQLDGRLLVDHSNGERFAALSERLPSELWIPRMVAESEAAAQDFVARALDSGHEGVLVKELSSAYDAGRRGSSWLKVKPAHTLDLVVLAAEWGNGRRQGFLSNLHLGARDPEHGGFVMLGKTFKGLTDELLAWQTAEFQKIAVDQRGHVVFLRPELVVEIAFDGVQQSPRYPGGLSLRFARVRRYRADKRAEEADTIDTVRAIFERSRGQRADAEVASEVEP